MNDIFNPFGLKNAPSEFQNIMNDIFNPYISFSIVYIDDVLIFSNTIEQRWKHLETFIKIVQYNGLVVSPTKIKLFQDKIRFLGHNIYQGKITPIDLHTVTTLVQKSLEQANLTMNIPTKTLGSDTIMTPRHRLTV